MPGSLLTPHDALSDRSEASYGSADSRASAKKVSFNRAVRVKQYPWTPDDNYLPEDGASHLSLPSRRFWFRVYKVKPQQVLNGDNLRDHNGSTCNGHSSQPHTTTSWAEDHAEDTYDSLAPIVEDDSTDHDDKNLQHINDPPFQRNQVKDIVSKFRDEPAEPLRRENGLHGYNSSRQTTSKNHMLNGFKAVLAKSQAKLKGEKKDISCRNAPRSDVRYSYREASPTKLSGISNSNYSRNLNQEKSAEDNDKPNLPIKIPRAESPRRGRDNIERFSLRYKTNQRRSRSTGDTTHSEASGRRLTSTDKSVSTDDLDSHDKSGLSWLNRANKDKSTQCNGTLLRNKPLTAYGTPRLSRSPFSNLLKREETTDKTSQIAKTAVNSSRSFPLNGRTTDDTNNRNARSPGQYESSTRNASSAAGRNAIITKPRIALNSYRSQNNKTNTPVANKEVYTSRDTKSQESTNLKAGDHSGGFAAAPSTGLYERGRGLSVVPEERPVSKQQWSSNTPLTERRASSWERSTRPTAATVGYHSGRYIAPQRLRGVSGVVSSFDTSQNGDDVISPKPRERNRLLTSKTRDTTSQSPQNSREFSNATSPLKNSSGDMIDWSLSGFQLGPPTVDRGLVSDSECFVHQRPPLLMYIPGVSHHERRAVEEDRMSGVSGISRADVDDDLRPLASATNSYVFNRRNSMPKDCNKSWVKWKVGGKPSRQP